MCEILLRVADKAAPDHPLRRHKTSRGDIIVVCDDGHPWSERELTNPEWRLIRLTGLPRHALDDVMTSVSDRRGILLDRRGRGIDLDGMPHIERRLKSGQVTALSADDATAFLAARKNRSTHNHLVLGA